MKTSDVMVFECNIDSKGRALRFFTGILALLGGGLAYLILMMEVIPVPESIGTLGVLAMFIGALPEGKSHVQDTYLWAGAPSPEVNSLERRSGQIWGIGAF